MAPHNYVAFTQIKQVSIVTFTILLPHTLQCRVLLLERDQESAACLIRKVLPEHSRPFLPLPAIALSILPLALRLCHPPPRHRPHTKPLLPQLTLLSLTTTPSIKEPSRTPQQRSQTYHTHSHTTYQKSIIMQIFVKTRMSTPLLAVASPPCDLC